MGGGAVGLGLVWILSILPLLLPALWAPAGASLGESSRLALVALPWIAWLGLPGRKSSNPFADLALALPPIAGGIAFDLSAGRERAPLAWTALFAIACAAALASAGARATHGVRNRRLHAILWLALVPGLPLLVAALELGGRPSYGDAPRWLELAARASPIAWIWGCASSSEELVPLAPLAVCAVLWGVAGLPERERTS